PRPRSRVDFPRPGSHTIYRRHTNLVLSPRCQDQHDGRRLSLKSGTEGRDMTPDRPVDNAPYFSHTLGGLTIEGWSRAAVQSYWRVPELNIGFDLGAQPWDFMGTPTWFVSHTHLDHIAALPVYVARRRMMRMEPPTLYLPAEAIEDVRRLLLIMQRLDRGRMLCELKGIEPGQDIALSRDHVVTAF